MDALRATSILSDEKPLFCGLVTKLSAVHECNGGCTVLSQRKAEAAVKYEESSADYLRSQILLFYLRKICRNGQEETFCNYLSLCDVAKQDRIGLGISPANVSDIQSGLLKRILASSSYRISGKVAVCLEHLERHLPVATDAGRKELAVMQENLDSTQLIQAGLQRASSDRLLLTVQLHKRLSDYISQMSTLIDRHLKPETKLCDASVASMEERTKSLLLKLKVEQLEVTKATYTARNMEALRKVRGLLAERTEQLSKDLEQRKLKAKQYEVVAGPDYQKLLAEHLKILEEIESCKWVELNIHSGFHHVLRTIQSASLTEASDFLVTMREFTLKLFCSKIEPLVLSHQVNDHIKRLVLNDPKRRNALSLAMLESLKDELKKGAEQKDLRVIILSGGVSPVFSSGHDLKELTTKTGLPYHSKIFAECTAVMKLIQDIQVPVIAEVKGLAAAAGCQLVATCDIVVAANTAKFSTPGINFGLFCSTPGVAVSRAVPRKVAMDMLLTGEAIDAQTALRSGLVSRVVPESELEQETLKVAEKISSLSRTVVSLGKVFFYGQIEHDRNTAYKLAERVMLENLRLKDCQEGLESFAQKRKPLWSHSTNKSH